MDRQTNDRLKALDRMLRINYEAVAKIAANHLNSNSVQEQLMIFEELSPDLTRTQRDMIIRSHLARVERETGLLSNIANDISRGGEVAGTMIQAESLIIFHAGYRLASSEIKTQVARSKINVSFGMIDKNLLDAIFNGEQTPLGKMPGFKSAFTQVGQIKADRLRGRFYFNRALGRLGDNPALVRRLQGQLAQSLILGESIPKIAARIRGITNSCRMQATRIARTETLRALNQGKMIGYFQAEEMGIPLKKKWLSTLDERTRDTHAPMMGETRNLDEPFSNGLMYPLDPNGDASEIINCRCLAISVVQTSRESEEYRQISEELEQRAKILGQKST